MTEATATPSKGTRTSFASKHPGWSTLLGWIKDLSIWLLLCTVLSLFRAIVFLMMTIAYTAWLAWPIFNLYWMNRYGLWNLWPWLISFELFFLIIIPWANRLYVRISYSENSWLEDFPALGHL